MYIHVHPYYISVSFKHAEDPDEGKTTSEIDSLPPFLFSLFPSLPPPPSLPLLLLNHSSFEVPQTLEPLTQCSLGQLCVAPFSQDGRWYRAVVVDTPKPGRVSYFSSLSLPPSLFLSFFLFSFDAHTLCYHLQLSSLQNILSPRPRPSSSSWITVGTRKQLCPLSTLSQTTSVLSPFK